jgi:hypothetical protein
MTLKCYSVENNVFSTGWRPPHLRVRHCIRAVWSCRARAAHPWPLSG